MYVSRHIYYAECLNIKLVYVETEDAIFDASRRVGEGKQTICHRPTFNAGAIRKHCFNPFCFSVATEQHLASNKNSIRITLK